MGLPPSSPSPFTYVAAPLASRKAVLSLVLGLASLSCLGFLGGIPAIVLGALSRREIDRSGGTLRGGGVAAAGIVTGLFGTGLSLVLGMAALSGAFSHHGQPREATVVDVPIRVPVAAGTRSYGSLDVVDLDEESPLGEQLEKLAKSAAKSGRTLVLQTYVRPSRECAEVAAALPDKRMQRALEGITLVRVDAELFEDDLASMRVDTRTVPWFYKLDAHARPVDAVSADEWEENVPENMAPVLGPFVRGKLGERRVPSPLGISL
jgi:hypothetical protein